MEDKVEKESPKKEEQGKEEEPMKEEQQSASTTTPKSGEGWGGWGFFAFSVLSNLQKAAIFAAGEISRNASMVAENVAKSIADIQLARDSKSSKEEEVEESPN